MDSRGKGAEGDLVSGDRMIEVKAFRWLGTRSALWLETRQVKAALGAPETFWLYIVENVRQGDSTQFRLLTCEPG